MKVAILGGGLTGLVLARHLADAQIDFTVLEAENTLGGLCRTIRINDFAFDLGVHAVYSRSRETMDYFHALPLHYNEHARQVRIGHWGPDNQIYELDYPFENGLGGLPIEDRVDCLDGYARCAVNPPHAFRNLRDWIDHGLGYGIARHFMIPYNEKIWNCDLADISMNLVNSKIEPAPLRTVIKSCLGERSVGRQYQASFIYPQGGIQRIPDALAAPISDRIRPGSPVIAMHRTGAGVWNITTSDGATYSAESVISTIPLPTLLRLVPLPLSAATQRAIRGNDTQFHMIGLWPKRSFHRFANSQWVFFAGHEIFYRITLMHNFDPHMPQSLVAEITLKTGQPQPSSATVKQTVVGDLIKAGLIDSSDDIAVHSVMDVPATYPIPTVGLDDAKQEIATKIKDLRLHLLGRNGAWDYINMDGVVQRVDQFMRTANF